MQRSKIGALLDHLVCAREQRCGHVEIERLSGLEVKHELPLGGRLNGKIDRLLSLQETIDVACGLAMKDMIIGS
jgi:hypothetical protein